MLSLKYSISILLLFISNAVLAHGLDDIPTFTEASIEASVDDNFLLNDEFVYQYVVSNSEINTGEIWRIDFDISTSRAFYTADFFPQSATSQTMTGSTFDMNEDAIKLSPYFGKYGSAVVPVGQRMPLGWVGGYQRSGQSGFSGVEPDAKILPGQSQGGFEFISKHPPGLRDVTLVALWFHQSESDDPSEEEWAQVAQATENTRIQLVTLAPSRERSLGSHKHWNVFVEDVQKMIELGWVNDASLANTILQQLTAAKTSMEMQDGTLAKQHLATLRETINTANDTSTESLSKEASILLLVNIDVLIHKTRDTPIPFEPVYSFTPEYSHFAVNEPYELVIKVLNAADQNRPVQGFELALQCSFTSAVGAANNCASFGLGGKSILRETNADGEVRIVIEKPKLGKAVIDVSIFGGEEHIGQATVIWAGGPDLVVPLFIPPLIQAPAGSEISLTEITMNQGNVVSAPSITRYYLSETTPIDVETAYVVGERNVDTLQAGEITSSYSTIFVIPAGLPDGVYALKACADAEDTIIETVEENNCSDSKLATISVVALPVVRNGNSAVVTINDVAIAEGDADTSLMEFEVTLDQADLFQALTLDWRTDDVSALAADDYEAGSGSLMFAAGTSELTQTVGVTVYGDQLVEPDETFNVVLSNPSELLSIAKAQGVGTILNDDSDTVLMDCSNAFASPSKLWPPNHKFKKIHIQGISHLSGVPFTTTVDAIYQDEPLNGVADGNTRIDGRGIGKRFAKVRRERSGLGDGRIYEIQFTASTDSGDSCSGSVMVGVPHDRKQKPVDSGIRFDSTVEDC